MTTASPNFAINGGAPLAKAVVAAGGAVQAILDSTSGIRSVTWSIIRTDDTTTPANYTLVQSGSVGQQVDLTALTPGTAAILQAEINVGIDQATERPSSTTRATAKFYVPTTAGNEVLTNDELVNTSLESNATHGAVEPINDAIRALDATAVSDWKNSAQLGTAAAIAAHSYAAGVITFSANGSQTVDGTATALGDRIVNMSEAVSHLEHGLYSVTTKGDGSTPEVWTRTPDADATGDLTPGATVLVLGGTANGGRFFSITTPASGTITIGTTAIGWTNPFLTAPKTVTDLAIPTFDGVDGLAMQDNPLCRIESGQLKLGTAALVASGGWINVEHTGNIINAKTVAGTVLGVATIADSSSTKVDLSWGNGLWVNFAYYRCSNSHIFKVGAGDETQMSVADGYVLVDNSRLRIRPGGTGVPTGTVGDIGLSANRAHIEVAHSVAGSYIPFQTSGDSIYLGDTSVQNNTILRAPTGKVVDLRLGSETYITLSGGNLFLLKPIILPENYLGSLVAPGYNQMIYAVVDADGVYALGYSDGVTWRHYIDGSAISADELHDMEVGGSTANCAFHLDANQGVTGDPVSAWADQSAAGNDGAQATAGLRPDFQAESFSSNDSIVFDGSDDSIQIPDAAGGELDPTGVSFLVLMAAEWLDGTGFTYKVPVGKSDGASGNGWRCFRTNNNTLALSYGTDAQLYTLSTHRVVTDRPTIMGWGVDASTDEVIYIVNGLIERKGITISGTANNALDVYIGRDQAGSYDSNIRIQQVAMWTCGASHISDGEIRDLVDHLCRRHGITRVVH